MGLQLFKNGGGTAAAAAQPAWFIDPVNGVDSATGLTSGHAIKTFAEYRRRVGTLGVASSTVSVMGALPSTDPMRPPYVPDGSIVIIDGALGATTLATAAVTAVTAVNRSTNTATNITASGLSANWSSAGPAGASLVNRRGRITSGARVGTIYWVAKDTGTKAARISQPTGTVPIDGETAVTLQIGDPFVIEALPTVADLVFDQPVSNVGFTVNLSIINFDLSAVAGTVPDTANGTFGAVCIGGCYLGEIEGAYQAFGCQTIDFFTSYTGLKTLDSCLFKGDVQLYAGAALYVTNCLSQGGGGWAMATGSTLFAHDLGVFDSTANGIDCAGALAQAGTLWGSGNAAYGVNVHVGGSMDWTAQPTITGTTNDAIIGGTAKAWSAINAAGFTAAGAFAYPYV